MQAADDIELLRQYAEEHSEEAFTALVTRHVNLVYSTSLRHVGRSHIAEEITQAVFVILAKKAGALRKGTVLSGWLYHTARLTAANHLRSEIQRTRREQEAHMQSILNESESNAWMQISPLLDVAMAGLSERDRNAIVLRFFEDKNLRDVGRAIGASEEAAKKRVNRAVEKLRRFFVKRGVVLTAAAIAGAISANSIRAAPVGLALSSVGAASGAAMSNSTLTLIQGALKLMAWTKAKTAIVIGVGFLLAAGTTSVAVREFREHRSYAWQGKEGLITENQADQPPQVKIVNSKFHEPDWAVLNGKLIGTGVSAQHVIASAYGFNTASRAIFSAPLPASRYDYIACFSNDQAANEKALQVEARQKFGVTGTIETRQTDVWVLQVKLPNAPGLKRNDRGYGNALRTAANGFQGWRESLNTLACLMEEMAKVPVIDETGLTNRFNFDLNCRQTDFQNQAWDKVNDALNQLGLELVPTHQAIEMLVVDKVK